MSKRVNIGSCSVEACDKPAKTRGWCHMHYQRWRLHCDLAYVNDPPLECTKCGSEKYRNPSGKIYCQKCDARFSKEYAVRNAEALRAAKQSYYKLNKDRIQDRNRNNYIENREAYAVSVRAWRLANPDLVRGYKQKWSAGNPEKGREYAARRRALYFAAICEHGPDCVTADVYRSVQERSCIYCGKPAEHADHYIPLTRGGLHCKDNIVPACLHCNLSKNNHMPDDWLTAVMPV